MEKIKIKMTYGQLTSFLEAYEVTELRDVSSSTRAVKSITGELYLKFWSKEAGLRTEKKDFTITLKYYQAWALCLFTSVIINQDLTDEYTKNCLHKLRNDIDQKL